MLRLDSRLPATSKNPLNLPCKPVLGNSCLISVFFTPSLACQFPWKNCIFLAFIKPLLTFIVNSPLAFKLSLIVFLLFPETANLPCILPFLIGRLKLSTSIPETITSPPQSPLL